MEGKTMRRGQGGRLSIPTEAELQQAVIKESEIVACSGLRQGPLAVMKLALNTLYTATVCVDVHSAVILVATLKELFPGCDSPQASPAIVTRTDNGIAVQAGHQSAPD
jgi:hypothetical protein